MWSLEEVVLEQSPLAGLGCELISDPFSQITARPCLDSFLSYSACHLVYPIELRAEKVTFQTKCWSDELHKMDQQDGALQGAEES